MPLPTVTGGFRPPATGRGFETEAECALEAGSLVAEPAAVRLGCPALEKILM